MELNCSSPKTIPVVSTFTANGSDSSSTRKPISLWPGMYHSPVTNALWEARSKIFERLLDPPKDAPPQSELLTKTPSQSRTTIFYNFSSDYILREQYRDPWNEVRMGMLLEDLDALAGTISVKHCSDDDSTTRPLLLVTAAVDKIVLKKPISVDIDLKIVGSVIWVGRSSIEIQLDVIQSLKEESDVSHSVALAANFIFVARDSKTGKAAAVNRLSPETEREKFLFEEAEARSKLRKKKRVDRRKLENGERNIHGRIFGGFLMHRAFELAFSTAYVFAGLVPCFLEVDHVDFLRPVDVGDFLRLTSCVLYTKLENPDQPLINVEVVAHVTRPEIRSSIKYILFHIQRPARGKGHKEWI
ncbi:hypothetical protein V6Z12_D11G161900 [Gossypium hirsutum]